MDTLIVRNLHKFTYHHLIKTIPFTAILLLRNNVRHGSLSVAFILFLKTVIALLIFLKLLQGPALCVALGWQPEFKVWGIHGLSSVFLASSLLPYFTTPSISLDKNEWPHVQVVFLLSGQRSWVNLKQSSGFLSPLQNSKHPLGVQETRSWVEKTKVHFHHHIFIILFGSSNKLIS